MRKWFQRRQALRRYRRELGVALRRRYGREPFYTPVQVQSTAVMNGLGIDYLCYALAMYCDRASFLAYHLARGEDCDYDAMRSAAGVACAGAPGAFDAASGDIDSDSSDTSGPSDTSDTSYAFSGSDFDAGGSVD